MKMKYTWIFVGLFVIIAGLVGFTYTVKEGSCVIVSRFGEIVDVSDDTGLHFKLPWPIDKTVEYDTRSQYLDSGYTETLTRDKINVILQNYVIWSIEDPELFYKSVGDFITAGKHLNDLLANVKNGVMGNYELSALVSTDLESIKIDEISKSIEENVSEAALRNYGIGIQSVKIKRLALPSANMNSVFEQMIADRQKYITQYKSEGERDSSIIISEANAEAAEIIAQGQLEASLIDAETEKKVAEIYGDAYDENSELFIFLKKLIALENSVNPDTVIIMRAEDTPFDVVTQP